MVKFRFQDLKKAEEIKNMMMNYPAFKYKSSDLKLQTDEIHVWCVSLDQLGPRYQLVSQTLSSDEYMRAKRFRFEKDRNRFIVGRGILRTILGYYLHLEPGKIQFCYGKYGKPALADTSGKGTICFNLSHSEGIALYAFNRDHEIGIDIEHIRNISEMDQIAERFFSVRENDVFRALPESKKKEAFFDCWTRKEAFIKVIGDGLYRPLDKFDVTLVPGEPARLQSMEGDSASRWSIQDLKPASGFAAAFAVKGINKQLSCFQWSNEVIEKSRFEKTSTYIYQLT